MIPSTGHRHHRRHRARNHRQPAIANRPEAAGIRTPAPLSMDYTMHSHHRSDYQHAYFRLILYRSIPSAAIPRRPRNTTPSPGRPAYTPCAPASDRADSRSACCSVACSRSSSCQQMRCPADCPRPSRPTQTARTPRPAPAWGIGSWDQWAWVGSSRGMARDNLRCDNMLSSLLSN